MCVCFSVGAFISPAHQHPSSLPGTSADEEIRLIFKAGQMKVHLCRGWWRGWKPKRPAGRPLAPSRLPQPSASAPSLARLAQKDADSYS